MKEQNGSEKNEKIEKKKKRTSKEKRFYLITSISCAAALVAIVLIAVLVTNFGGVELPTAGNNSSINQPSNGGNGGDVGDGGNDEPVINTPEGMIMPLESVSVVNDFGFYHNKTLNNYYEHKGVDFTAEVGTEVLAADDGVIVTIYRDDVLTGTEITIDHGDGVKTVYRFVDVAEGISVGTDVKKGDVIATVAEATGEEYKDGAHLHFEVIKSGQQVDPATYLTFEEK
jgi:murein DD-endopeptidase MepM/ murein hydrolase activator NlpD